MDGLLIPRARRLQPIAVSYLNTIAGLAPLLKLRQYGAFTFVNRLGVLAYDPGGPYRGGPAPLTWGTQLFPNGELWLTSNTMIVRERSGRPSWLPIPFIPATIFEAVFFDKLRAALAFAVEHLELTFPCDIEMGLIGTNDVTLAVEQDDMRPIRTEKFVVRQTLPNGSDEAVNAALVAFFNQVYDATGYARPEGLFGFPPGPPRLRS